MRRFISSSGPRSPSQRDFIGEVSHQQASFIIQRESKEQLKQFLNQVGFRSIDFTVKFTTSLNPPSQIELTTP